MRLMYYEASSCIDSCWQIFMWLDGTRYPVRRKSCQSLIGGDSKQILPVAVHANRTAIIVKCLKNSPIWMRFQQFTLIQNMKANTAKTTVFRFLSLGDGTRKMNMG